MRDYAKIETMTLDEAVRGIENDAIQASMLVERRESKETYGNGWHAAQSIGDYAAMQMVSHWRNREEAEAYCQTRWKASLDDIIYALRRVASPARKPGLLARLIDAFLS